MEQKHLIGQEIRIVSNLIKRNVDNTTAMEQLFTLSGTQCFVLGFLYENKHRDVFQRDLETEFSIRRSTATGILNLLEKNQMIKRESVSYDARLKKLVLTDKALELHQQIEAEIAFVENRLAEGISSEEMEVFNRVLEKMKKNLS